MTSVARTFAVLLFCAGAGSAGAAEPPAIADAWIRATPPGARTAAAYLTITSSTAADRLLGAATPAAATVEIHAHVVEAGMSRMVRLPELTLPAGEAIRLEPGGLHLMLLDITGPLVAGTRIGVSLQFAAAGTVDIEVPVVDARARAATPHASH